LVVASLLLGAAATGCGSSQDDKEVRESGRIAFEREGDVYMMDTSGENETKVPTAYQRVSWSPDGARIVYSNPEGEILVANSETGATVWQTRAPSEFKRCFLPVWSPHGDLIACEYDLEPSFIATVDATTQASSTKRLTPDCCRQPVWSPDGKRIAYWSFGTYSPERGYFGPSGLFVMSADGTGKRRLTPRGDAGSYINPPAWSSDGHTIAFIDGHDVWTIDARGGKPRRVLNGGNRTTNYLAWSPNGRKLAFTHGDGHDFEIFVMNPDGTGLRNLTHNERNDRQPTWSPDGKALAFSTNRALNYEIYVINADGTNPTRLTDTDEDESDPNWSPMPTTIRKSP
jgi:Tol biopolymer transport system component